MAWKDPARRLLSAADEEKILAAIREAEGRTSGEIRVHIEARSRDPRADAERWFVRLGMARTSRRNGVLFFLAAIDRAFAVIGDEGIHKHVGDPYWASLRDRLAERFRGGEIAAGLAEAIRSVGSELARAFPRESSDANELPDTISFGDDGEKRS